MINDILLVEDNLELAELIQAFLIQDGYAIRHVTSGEDAEIFLNGNSVKIVLLDIMLPGMDGFSVCRKIREKGNVPILIMSARSGKADQLAGFELGADDYLEKPVDPDILSAKIRALLARSGRLKPPGEILSSGGITIDRRARKAYRDDQPLELNVKEYELLLLFADNPGKTLHKDYLFNQIWGPSSFSESQTLTVHIKMLRTKIEENPRQPQRILTVWGIGYRYEEI